MSEPLSVEQAKMFKVAMSLLFGKLEGRMRERQKRIEYMIRLAEHQSVSTSYPLSLTGFVGETCPVYTTEGDVLCFIRDAINQKISRDEIAGVAP